MTDEQMRVAIAEACGWKEVSLCANGYVVGLPSGFTEDQCPEGADEEVPDYPNDLNAMHEAEECLHPAQLGDYANKLTTVVGVYWFNQGKAVIKFSKEDWTYATAHATARQRSEAFLRTLGKWTE
jgi:hypothetical protein